MFFSLIGKKIVDLQGVYVRKYMCLLFVLIHLFAPIKEPFFI